VRWRLRVAAGRPLDRLSEAATAAAGRVLGPDLVRSAVYEPQQTLFGGPLSMEFVHQTWSADSMLWMRWHAQQTRPLTMARWELSFSVLAQVFSKLGVVGWEDREVWNCLVEETGRRLAEREWSRPEVVAVARSLRDRWDSVWGTPSAPPRPYGGANAGHLHDFATHAGPVLSRWHAECLSAPAAGHALTPRKAAAYWTVFHWNRAGLAAAQQALAAQTLAGRLPREGDLVR
jgi:Lantibiotic biosynthesis dehydratase C-term